MNKFEVIKASKKYYDDIIRIGMKPHTTYVALNNQEVVGYFSGEVEENIIYDLYIITKKRGFSRKILEFIFNELKVNKIIAETNDENKNYWLHLGAEVDEKYSCEVREMYDFILKNKKCGGIKMLKFKLGQEFSLNQNIEWETSTVYIKAKKDSKIEIIELDNSDEYCYKVFFNDCNEWIYLSEEELEEISK